MLDVGCGDRKLSRRIANNRMSAKHIITESGGGQIDIGMPLRRIQLPLSLAIQSLTAAVLELAALNWVVANLLSLRIQSVITVLAVWD